jgi:hypothetical protein
MNVSQLVNINDLTCLDIEQIPCFIFDKETSITKQIASHLKSLLEQYGTAPDVRLKLPSLFELSAFYNQSISNILMALIELKAAHYDYIMHSMDENFILYDPLSRRNISISFPLDKILA